VIIGWVAVKLVAEYAHEVHWIGWEIPRWLSLGLIVAIFIVSFAYARRQPPPPPETAG